MFTKYWYLEVRAKELWTGHVSPLLTWYQGHPTLVAAAMAKKKKKRKQPRVDPDQNGMVLETLWEREARWGPGDPGLEPPVDIVFRNHSSPGELECSAVW